MKGLLLDIEGTTTPISFVYDVLFPFARARLHTRSPGELITRFSEDFAKDVAAGLQPPPLEADPTHYVEWLMDRDRKSTALKTLQGQIWQEGFESGLLHGEVFPDVPEALARWHAAGIDVRIYSSGSILAQKLLFSSTRYGDLTRFLRGFFDTTTGPKTYPGSYSTIATAFGLPAEAIAFISDSTPELDAATLAGMSALFSERPGNPPHSAHKYRTITAFSQLLP